MVILFSIFPDPHHFTAEQVIFIVKVLRPKVNRKNICFGIKAINFAFSAENPAKSLFLLKSMAVFQSASPLDSSP